MAQDRTGSSMKDRWRQFQAPAPAVGTSVIYAFALLAGVILICSGRASVPEATGYVTPFLLIHERTVTQLRAALPYSSGVQQPQQPSMASRDVPRPLSGQNDPR